MNAGSNIADYRLSLEGRDLGLGAPTGISVFGIDFGKLLMDRIGPRLIGLQLTEKRGGEADQLDITIHDHDGQMEIPKAGAVLSLALGWKGGADVTLGLVPKGRFKVDEAEWSGPPDIVTIRARSADFAASFNVRKERSHRDTTVGAIVAKVAREQGLQPHCDPALANIPVPVLAQDGQSDMAMIRELGRRHDAVATVKDGKLILAPIGRGRTAAGKAIAGLLITRASGEAYSYRRAERGQYGGVEAGWHDQDAGKRKTVKVGTAVEGRKPKRLKKTYATEADARRAAEAEQGRMNRAAAEFGITLALGRPDIFPDRPATLSGFKPEIDAKRWLIAEVMHTLDASGLHSALKLQTLT
ncbi:contractile injection system protein, VgrG/Pvc8 family [Novosphingopyxis sp. YJ-S2-01]|uniref:contractile injection system protein, VgrG/Pvc8 family n=1 Tax=Novosphingopyxis sp. YJ-S2-01 TaxID=2794021 RepID=UPI0018DDC7AE|nr:contractile injection system protein, VgrG/Pvc8 family [Novosphingopyxis sp. YJ-S2-01]MBH9536916.1 phage late control D family protein [Novosphingopyxis sp. YJ-S2-01]